MPADVNKVFADFPGLGSYGNATTCAIQGFLILTGESAAVCGLVSLSIYYVLTLRYGVSETALNRYRFLPATLSVLLILALPGTLLPLCLGFINPVPFEIYCQVGAYPYGCNLDNAADVECIRGGNVDQNTDFMIFLYITIILCLSMFLIIASLVLVVLTVFSVDRLTRRLRQQADESSLTPQNERENFEEEGNRGVVAHEYPEPTHDAEGAGQQEQEEVSRSNDRSSNREQQREARTASCIALMYISAFFITWIWTIISIMPIAAIKNMSQSGWDILNNLRHFFVPLQGLFNTMIFIYHKAHTIRKSSEDTTLMTAIIMTIKSPKLVPPVKIVLSLDMVKKDAAHARKIDEIAELESKQTPTKSLGQVLSQTGMLGEDVTEDSPKRQFYMTDTNDVGDRFLCPPNMNHTDLSFEQESKKENYNSSDATDSGMTRSATRNTRMLDAFSSTQEHHREASSSSVTRSNLRPPVDPHTGISSNDEGESSSSSNLSDSEGGSDLIRYMFYNY
jgi:hypothetical protein